MGGRAFILLKRRSPAAECPKQTEAGPTVLLKILGESAAMGCRSAFRVIWLIRRKFVFFVIQFTSAAQ
jgi:hypothetical protein